MVAASGMVGDQEIRDISPEQLVGIVTFYSSGQIIDPPGARLEEMVQSIVDQRLATKDGKQRRAEAE